MPSMGRLVECVPNVSEGRNAGTVRALVAAAKAVRGVYLLDEEMDHDHHRAVLTFVGSPEAVAEAAFRTVRAAAELIDLRTHQGGHPRVGAADVLPFVPVKGVTMDECVTLARAVGERIGRELAIPVFLYERAAAQPARANLEAIRRGGSEGLAQRMATDPLWVPDFGPRMLHSTAGATIVGARPPLIAYNVNLRTRDVAVAKAIAKTIRASGGGIPYLKAIGVDLPSRQLTQVSMNLTSFDQTPIHVAWEAVRKEAERRGVHVASSEVVGLIPQRALVAAAERFLGLERFDPTQVLETRLDIVLAREASLEDREAPSQDWSLSAAGFLEAVAAGTPTPAGGSVSALAGALAAALGVMVCRIGPARTQAPPASEPGAPQSAGEQLRTAERRLATLVERLRTLIQTDAAAYADVTRAYRLPKTDASRPEVIAVSLRIATEVPLETASLASEVAGILRMLSPLVKPSVTSDLKVGLLMARAALEGALDNVIVNMKDMTNQSLVDSIGSKLQPLQQSLVELKSL